MFNTLAGYAVGVGTDTVTVGLKDAGTVNTDSA